MKRSPDSKGKFSVISLYDVLCGEQATVLGWKRFWSKLVLSKVAVFFRVARLHKIFIVDNLQKRGHIFVNGCLLRKLRIICSFIIVFPTKVWVAVLNKFGITWVMTRIVLE